MSGPASSPPQVVFVWVVGDSLDNVFPIVLELETYFGQLNKRIKAEQHPRFEDMPASHLVLYGIPAAVGKIAHTLVAVDLTNLEKYKLGPTRPLSQVSWADDLCFVIIVTVTPVSRVGA